jgi:hypothetical protein
MSQFCFATVVYTKKTTQVLGIYFILTCVMSAGRYKCVTMSPYSSFFSCKDNKHFHCLTRSRRGLCSPEPHLVKVRAPLQGRLYIGPSIIPTCQSGAVYTSVTRDTMKISCKVRTTNSRAECLRSRGNGGCFQYSFTADTN